MGFEFQLETDNAFSYVIFSSHAVECFGKVSLSVNADMQGMGA
jgi:hypothetical protein